MEKLEKIDERIVDLKWRALPLAERLMTSKNKLKETKYQVKSRKSQLRWYNQSCYLSIIIISLLNLYLFFNEAVSTEFRFFAFSVLVILLAQKLELWLRYQYLNEVHFLKRIKKEIIH
ncbi:MAG: hypothetical protein RIA69_13395 [Cyclobacteriaceae bacterium]